MTDGRDLLTSCSSDYYSAEMFKIHAHRVGAYVELLAHANPYLKILEIGAGTGSSAAGVLPFLTCHQGNGRSFTRYVMI